MKKYTVKNDCLEIDGKYYKIKEVKHSGISIETESDNGAEIIQLIPWASIKG